METNIPQNLERRTFPRIEDNIFIFANLSTPTNKLRRTVTGVFKAFTKNIGAGGLMFETERNIIEKGNKLEMEIYQPLKPDKTLVYSMSALANVMWTKKIEKEHFENGENKYQVGVEFLEIRGQDRQKIVKYINKVVAEKRTFIK